MSDLPLFPLHTVLFPHTPIQLHIFEDRYQRMIEMCLREKRPFGVVLIRRGAEALGPLAEPCTVGCTADIIVTQPLGGGRMNLVALGGERFHIRSLDTQSQPYLTGRIEPYPWKMPDPGKLARRSEVLRSQVRRYLDFLVSQRGSDAVIDAQKLPDSDFELACLAAAILDIDPAQKQTLLESESFDTMLDDLLNIYRREAALMQALQERGKRDEPPFSLN